MLTVAIPDNHNSQVVYNYEKQIIALQTTKGLLHDHHAYHCEDQCVGKISQHLPKPVKYRIGINEGFLVTSKKNRNKMFFY